MAETVSNIEYTFQRIHEVASELAALTKSPSLGCGTYMQAVDAVMNELDTLRTVQQVPRTPSPIIVEDCTVESSVPARIRPEQNASVIASDTRAS